MAQYTQHSLSGFCKTCPIVCSMNPHGELLNYAQGNDV
jgi:hypothetical protein